MHRESFQGKWLQRRQGRVMQWEERDMLQWLLRPEGRGKLQ